MPTTPTALCGSAKLFLQEQLLEWPNTSSFRSAHPGGLNFSLADASVHFIDAATDMAIYRALATRAGGETVSGY